jgi:hypothetical protein
LRFGLRDPAAARRQVIGAATRIVGIGIAFGDPAVVEQLAQRPVERRRVEHDAPVGRCFHLASDRVAVDVALGEGEQNVKRRGRKGRLNVAMSQRVS